MYAHVIFPTYKKLEWVAAYAYVIFHIQVLPFISFHITFWFTGYVVSTRQVFFTVNKLYSDELEKCEMHVNSFVKELSN